MNGYTFSRQWFNFSFDNPDLVSPTHTAMYMWFLELNNRMGWADKFSSPASQTMQAIGLKSYNTYKKIFTDLVSFKFVIVITESKNQYTACVIALSKFDKAVDTPLDKSIELPNQILTKQSESTVQSNDSVIKPKTIETIKDTILGVTPNYLYTSMVDYWLKEVHAGWTFSGVHGAKIKSLITKLKKIIKDSGKELSDEIVLDTFKKMCENLPEYFKDKDLSVIDSKFNEIITQIKNKKNGTTQQITKDIGQQYRAFV